MNFLHRIAIVTRLGIVWMVLWGVAGAAISIVIGIVDPPSIDAGEGPLDSARIIGGVGGVSGVVFGLLLVIGERRREVADVPLLRAAMWGVVAGAALPLLTSMNNVLVTNTCPLGALAAVAAVALARRTRPPARAIITALLALAMLAASPSRGAAMNDVELKDFATKYTAAWCSRNPASVAAFFAERGSLTINDGAPNVGRAAIIAAAQGFMAAFPDMVVAMDGTRLGGNDGRRAIYRWTLAGTNTGPGGSGNSVRISGHEKWTFDENGLIAESLGHFDAAEYERQLKAGATSDDGGDTLAQHLRELEESLLQPDVRRSNRLVELLADDFIEFGSSGRIYTRADLVVTLQEESPVTQTTSDFRAEILGTHAALLTYRIHRHSNPPVYTLRSSLWQMKDGRWRMSFHQATLTSAPQ